MESPPKCSNCRKWLIQRVTDYADGSRIINFKTPDGVGHCEHLKVDTVESFGCNEFVEGHEHVQIMGQKSGSPWHHSHYGVCPDCSGVGWKCQRCAGTGKVLYYDDGYIGEEQHRRHPNEDKAGSPPIPRCVDCQREVDPNWVACPYCGARTNKPDEPVYQTEVL